MKKDFGFFSSKEKALAALTNDLGRDRPINPAHIEALQQSLSPEELKGSEDTLTVMRMRAYLADGKPLQAYNVLMPALRAQPLNLFLQLEYYPCLNSVLERFKSLATDDLHNPLIELHYQALYKEAYLNQQTQTMYLAYLVAHSRWTEAAAIAESLVELFPAQLGLRDLVEQIASHVPNEILSKFLSKRPLKFGREIVCKSRTPNEIISMRQQYGKVLEQVNSPEPQPWVAKFFNDILGEVSELAPIDASVRDIYYLKALYEGKIGNLWAAIQILQALVEIWPCDLYFRFALEVEAMKFCEQKDLKVDARKAFSVLREFVVVPFGMHKHIALAHVADGEVSAAKAIIDRLLRLNPIDNDYLLLALDVAMEAGDESWVDELMAKIKNVSAERPWDLKLRAMLGSE